jgi:hypothetical protein
MFLTTAQADAYSLFQTSRSFQMSKTNDQSRALRAYREYLTSPAQDRVVLQRLKARADAYNAPQVAA